MIYRTAMVVLMVLHSEPALAQSGGAELGVPTTIQRIELDIAKLNDRTDALARRINDIGDRVRFFEERILNLLEQQQKPPVRQVRQVRQERQERRRKVRKGYD